MSVIIKLNESNASRRVVPLPPLVKSNGTSACTNESGRTFFFSVGGRDYGSGGSISAISAEAGLYECLFSASKVSTLGQGRVYYSSGTALPATTPIEIVPWDSYDSMRLGLFALPDAAPGAANGLVAFGTGAGQLHVSSGSVGLKAQTHSDATIKGIQNIQGGTFSDVSFSVRNGGIQAVSIGAGNYSGVSVGIYNKGIEARSFVTTSVYSHLSIGGANRIDSSVTIAGADYSAVTVRLSDYNYASRVTVGVGNIAAGNYSSVTIQGVSNTSSAAALVSDITAGVWYAGDRSGVTIDGVRRIAVAGERSLASSILSSPMGNNRILQEYFWPLRNRVQISGSTGTVFLPDDATSSWTFSSTTADFPLSGIDPGGT